MHDLPTVSAALTTENWQHEINRMACKSAADALRDLGTVPTVELALALLHTYFLLTYSASLPFVEDDGTVAARLDTLRKILKSCGLEFDTNIITVEKKQAD